MGTIPVRLNSTPGTFAAYAAFSAADFQAPHVRQPKTWLYISKQLEEELSIRFEAKPVDSGENLVVLIPEDDGVFYKWESEGPDEGRLPRTNIIQTYVDLYHCGGRGKEAAEALLSQRLNPEWRQKGFES